MSFFWLPVKQELTTEQWSDGAAQATEKKDDGMEFGKGQFAIMNGGISLLGLHRGQLEEPSQIDLEMHPQQGQPV